MLIFIFIWFIIFTGPIFLNYLLIYRILFFDMRHHSKLMARLFTLWKKGFVIDVCVFEKLLCELIKRFISHFIFHLQYFLVKHSFSLRRHKHFDELGCRPLQLLINAGIFFFHINNINISFQKLFKKFNLFWREKVYNFFLCN